MHAGELLLDNRGCMKVNDWLREDASSLSLMALNLMCGLPRNLVERMKTRSRKSSNFASKEEESVKENRESEMIEKMVTLTVRLNKNKLNLSGIGFGGTASAKTKYKRFSFTKI